MTRPRPGRVLVTAAWPPELRRWHTALARAPELARPVVARTVGVGLVEAALGAARAIADERPWAVVFIGTAGAYPDTGRTLAVGSAVSIRRLTLLSHSVARGDGYFPRPLPTEAATDPALRDAIEKAAALPWANLACPLAITRSLAAGRRAEGDAAPLLENLEGFAVARAAAAASLPFAAVVGVANAVGPRGHHQWKRSAATAAASACDALIRWLQAGGAVRGSRGGRKGPRGPVAR
jgi:futalosine hydrolase